MNRLYPNIIVSFPNGMHLASYPGMRHGFTLIEMLVTISLIFIIFMLPCSGFRSLIRASALENAARQTENALFLAKQKAVSSGSVVEVSCFNSLVLIRKQNLATNSFDLVKTGSLPDRTSFTNSVAFRFSSSGFCVPGYTGTAVIGNSGPRTRKVVVSSAGRIRLE